MGTQDVGTSGCGHMGVQGHGDSGSWASGDSGTQDWGCSIVKVGDLRSGTRGGEKQKEPLNFFYFESIIRSLALIATV